jgi:hypothetical protein
MRTFKFLALTALAATTAFASFGPPWISIEYPGNPYAQDARDAYLYVHAFHHGTPVGFPVSGTAEGLVSGARRTISLEFKTTSRPGVYSLRKQWPTDGVWTLVVGVTQGEGEGNTASAIVELGADGTVASVVVPTKKARDGYTIPAPVAMSAIEDGLKTRAARVATR